jgi:hypothetical protein
MANKVKQPTKVKEPVRIMYRAISAGNQSTYPDYYYSGKREFEFLNSIWFLKPLLRMQNEYNPFVQAIIFDKSGNL